MGGGTTGWVAFFAAVSGASLPAGLSEEMGKRRLAEGRKNPAWLPLDWGSWISKITCFQFDGSPSGAGPRKEGMNPTHGVEWPVAEFTSG